jgi:hypothetical protein
MCLELMRTMYLDFPCRDPQSMKAVGEMIEKRGCLKLEKGARGRGMRRLTFRPFDDVPIVIC